MLDRNRHLSASKAVNGLYKSIANDLKTFLLTSLMAVFASSFVYAAAPRCEALFSVQEKPFLKVSLDKNFLVPNEKNLGLVRSQFSTGATGIYVSVGTERGFMSAALTGEKTKALVLIDRDANVASFNHVNKALLALARSREDYLQLRLQSSFEDLQKRVLQDPHLSAENKETLMDASIWQWWQLQVQQSAEWRVFHQDPRLREDTSYRDTNYLFDDQLFQAVSSLAKQNKIFVMHSDLAADQVVFGLTELSQHLQQRLSYVDLSNSWQEGYLGHQKTLQLLTDLSSAMSPFTRLVFTYQALDFQGGNQRTIFKYSFVERDSLTTFQSLGSHLVNLERAEPSRPRPDRARMSRFGFDD